MTRLFVSLLVLVSAVAPAMAEQDPAAVKADNRIRTVVFISPISRRAKRFENVRVSRWARSIRMSATSVGSSARLTPAIASARFSASASRSASASEALSDSV